MAGSVLIAGGASAPAAPAEVYNPGIGRFTKTGRMVAVRFNATATLLGDGKVLIAGGCREYECSSPSSYLSSAELYDPSTGRFRATGHMARRREYAAAVLLEDGRVLVTGGGIRPLVGPPTSSCPGLASDSVTDSAELYDPRTARFATAGRMTDAREVHTATLLNDGTVLIAGGCGLSTAELYFPDSNRFVATGAMTVGRSGHTATLLADGEVLIAGGVDNTYKILASAELYNPSTGTFTETGSMNEPRIGATATPLSNGEVLVAGGFSGSVVASAELYDPPTGSFTPTGSMGTPRVAATATLLDDGRVLVAGGYGNPVAPPPAPAGLVATGDYAPTGDSAELYDPATGSFSPTGSMSFARRGATATLLR